MTSLKLKQRGFTIIELLIVIIVIGILALLVYTSFNNVTRDARNRERETDIKAIHSSLEAYYAQNGNYPTLANLNDSSWRDTNFRGFDSAALQDPQGSAETLASAAAEDVYAYVVTDDSGNACDNGASGGTDCTQYTLTATYEGGGTFEKTNLN